MLARLILACVIGLSAGSYYYNNFGGPIAVDDFIAGPAVYYATEKAKDYGAALAMILTSCAVIILLHFLFRILRSRYGGIAAREFEKGIWWILVPAITWFANAIASDWNPQFNLYHAQSLSLLLISTWLTLPWLLSIWGFARIRKTNPELQFHEIFVGVLVVCGFCAFTFIGLEILVSRFLPSAVTPYLSIHTVDTIYLSGSVALMAVSVLLAFSSRVIFHLRRLVSIVQFGALPFFAYLMPRWWMDGSGTVTRITPISIPLVALLLLGAAIVAYGIIRRANRASIYQRLSALSFVPIILAYTSAYFEAPFFPSDDYHYGEKISSYWALQHGAILYTDIIPPHGLLSVLPFFISDLVFHSGLQLGVYAERVVYSLIAAGFFLIVARFSSVALSLVFILFLPYSFQYQSTLFQMGLLLLVVGYYDKMQPRNWLLFSSIIILAALILEPIRGGAIGVALFIPWVLKLYVACKYDSRGLAKLFGAALLGLLLLSFVYPIWEMFEGIVTYLFEQSKVNEAAYAGPWVSSWQTVLDGQSSIAWEMLRFLWIPAIPVLIMLALDENKAVNCKDPKHCINYKLLSILMVLAIIPTFYYYLGRVDALSLSRTGLISLIISALALPVIFNAKFPGKPFALITSAFFVGLFGGGFPLEGIRNATTALYRLPPSSEIPLTLEAVKGVVLEPDHRDRLAKLQSILDKILTKQETYLDLTNRSAQYAYLARTVPIAIPAPYNMIHPNDQRRAIERLQNADVPLALLWADNILHDGGSPALRTSLLYRWIVQHYQPMSQGSFIVAVRPERLKKLAPFPETIALAPRTEAGWQNGISTTEPTITVAEARTLAGLRPGDALEFPASGTRQIRAIDGALVSLDGMLDAEKDGIGDIAVILSKTTQEARRLALLDAVFRIESLDFLPQIWGASSKNLTGDLEEVGNLTLINSSTTDFQFAVNPATSGTLAGYLTFSFVCQNPLNKAGYSLTVRWQGQTQSVLFHGGNGRFIIPLEAYPSWLLNPHITEITIATVPEKACGLLRIEDARLWRRE